MQLKSLEGCQLAIGSYPPFDYDAQGGGGKGTVIQNEKDNFPFLTIITVVKNGMPFLKSAIMSFNLQSYKNKELIIVYASSNDGTEEYLQNLNSSNIFIKKDLNSKTKFGSINLGINISSGDIIGLLHSDDVFYNENTLDDISYNFNNDIDLLYGDVLFSKNNNLSKITRIWKSNKLSVRTQSDPPKKPVNSYH